MILVDYNQVMIANIFAQLGPHKNAKLDVDMLRHMALNVLLSYNRKFRSAYGNIVICADDHNYWRRDLFPYYKIRRKTTQAESETDWRTIFQALNDIREEIEEDLPYKVIKVHRAEADDIIGTIIHHVGTELPTSPAHLIVSRDKDFFNLQRYGNVHQYDQVNKKFIRVANPMRQLQELIIKGDSGDDIPNIRSEDASIVNKIRQKPVTQKMLDKWIDMPDSMTLEESRNYHRNQVLIDLEYVPEDIKEAILAKYNEPNEKTRSKVRNYLMRHNLSVLLDQLNDF